MTAYPFASPSDVVEEFHGTPIADPYRWLEDPSAAETANFVAAQNAFSRAFLDALPDRRRFLRRLTELWNFPRFGAPMSRGDRYFFTRNDGLQNQPVLYVTTDLAAHPEVLLDPNALSVDGTVALTNIAPSENGRYLAYGTSTSGSDWQVVRVRDVDTGQDLPDTIQWCKFTDIAWLMDGTGFYYARYPSPDELTAGELAGEPASTHHRVYLHRIGTAQADDMLVYARPDEREYGFDPHVTDDGNYLVLNVWEGTDTRNRIYYRAVDSDAHFVRLLDEKDARYDFLGNDGPIFYFLTDQDAPKGRVVAIDTRQPEPAAWRELVPEQDHALDFGRMAGDHFVLLRLVDASHRVEIYHLDGESAGNADLPDLGQIVELQTRRHADAFFITFTSFLYPPTVLRQDSATGSTETVWQPELSLDLTAYETTQVFVPGKDGHRIPVFIVGRRDLPRDGQRPTLLYGYGGFSVNVLPAFSPIRLLWLEQGAYFASANLRGGGEYGEEWHKSGMLGRKQNVFNDYIAAAEWLIANDYTSPEHLAIEGRSNGGLLTAATLLQRPDLFGAVHSAVPVIDMLRYQNFTAGRYWTPEYGDATLDAEQFAYLRAYSPLHNVQAGVDYPPLLITTGDTDDRVVPMHALKFAATLQAAADHEFDPQHPVLVRIETSAGHGLGKPTAKLIEEAADVTAFLWSFVGDQAVE